jgi:hypothetical protein
VPLGGSAVDPYDYMPHAKGQVDQRPGILGGGGPDAFGYRWIDSDEPGGPAFHWIDISDTGTPIPFSAFSDEENLGLPIGFPFPYPFYGNGFFGLRVCTNGWLSFTSTATLFDNQPLPNSDPAVPENLLAVLWDDLVYSSQFSSAYYQNDGTKLVVQFNNFARYGDLRPPFFTFEAILYPDGQFVFQYLSLGPVVNSATVGIQNDLRNDGLTVVFDAAYLHDHLAVQFLRPEPGWIQLEPHNGTVQPGTCANLLVSLDASSVPPGARIAQLLLGSNDPDEPVLSSYVVLQVPGTSDLLADLEPSPLDLSVRSGDVTAYVELSQPRDVHDIDVASVRLAGVPALLQGSSVGDHDADGVPDLGLRFPRSTLQAALPEGNPVNLLLVGRMRSGQEFSGQVRAAVRRHAVEAPNGGETLHVGATTEVRWSVPEGWAPERADLSFSPDDGGSWVPIASGVVTSSYFWQIRNQATNLGRIRVELFDGLGSLGADTSEEAFTILSTAPTEAAPLPRAYALEQNSPNPFNPTTTIGYALPEAAAVRLAVYDPEGRLVRVLTDRRMPAGRYSVAWDGRDVKGQRVASGVYFYRLVAGRFTDTKRMAILK